MQSVNRYSVINIRECLDNEQLGNEALTELISEFSCPLNPDVERFLREKASEFAKKHQAVTYLVLSSETAELVGYFSVTIKPLVVSTESFSNTIKRKLSRFGEIDEGTRSCNIAAYLIAQLGRNFNPHLKDKISGMLLVEAALQKIRHMQYDAGGMVVFVEAENKEKLLDFYRDCGFKSFSIRQTSTDKGSRELIQLLTLI